MSGRIWTCDVCQRRARWGDDWQQWGTMDHVVFVVCSDECAKRAERFAPTSKPRQGFYDTAEVASTRAKLGMSVGHNIGEAVRSS